MAMNNTAANQGAHLSDDQISERWGYLVRLLRLLWTLSPGAMAVIAAVDVTTGLLPLLSLAVLRHLVDVVTNGGNGLAQLRQALFWVAALVVTSALPQTAWILGSIVKNGIQERLKALVQERIIAKAQALPLAAFEQAEIYDQLQRIETGLDSRLFSTMTFVFGNTAALVTLISLIIYMGLSHWSLPLLLIIGTTLSVLPRLRILRERYILERKQTERERRLGYIEWLMAGREAAAEVRLFGLGDHLLGSWARLYGELRNERLALVGREFRFEGGSSTAESLTFGLALTVVVSLVAGGALTLGQYAAFVGAVQQFQHSLFGLFWTVALIDNDLRYIRDFFLYMDQPEDTSFGSVASDWRPDTIVRNGSISNKRMVFKEDIVFENVSFCYPGSDRLVLKGVSLRIRAGERLALIGENGAGKTTLAKLLLGLYHPTEGRILVDGINLTHLDPQAWRSQTAAVFQDFQQYHLSVRENIAFGDLDRRDDEAAISQAARLSGAASVVADLPQGYNTLLGKDFEEGQELSQGQWQKIAVARAYLRDADVLVLDEPTAALDARAEVEIYRQFRDVSVGKTVLLISHRLGSARLADRILVLDNGAIAEQGTHADLLTLGGRYAHMLGVQSQWYS